MTGTPRKINSFNADCSSSKQNFPPFLIFISPLVGRRQQKQPPELIYQTQPEAQQHIHILDLSRLQVLYQYNHDHSLLLFFHFAACTGTVKTIRTTFCYTLYYLVLLFSSLYFVSFLKVLPPDMQCALLRYILKLFHPLPLVVLWYSFLLFLNYLLFTRPRSAYLLSQTVCL